MGKRIDKKYGSGATAALVMTGILALLVCISVSFTLAANGTFTTNKHWKQKWERIGGTAGESIGIGEAVAFHPQSGKVYKADANSSTRRPAVGLSGTSAVANQEIEIVRRGILSGMPAGLGTESSNCVTPIGIPLYLASDPAGGVTHIHTTVSGVTAVGTGITQFLATALPLSQEAVRAGVTTGTDTYLVNVSDPEHRSGTTIGALSDHWE